MGSEGGLSEFIDGLGPGQLVGRQVLASPALGEIQLSLCDRRGNLEVEVIRARGLQCKPGSKVLPGKHLLILSISINFIWIKGNCCSICKLCLFSEYEHLPTKISHIV